MNYRIVIPQDLQRVDYRNLCTSDLCILIPYNLRFVILIEGRGGGTSNVSMMIILCVRSAVSFTLIIDARSSRCTFYLSHNKKEVESAMDPLHWTLWKI